MIRYHRLYEADDYSIRRWDMVEYAGYGWIVLRIEGEASIPILAS